MRSQLIAITFATMVVTVGVLPQVKAQEISFLTNNFQTPSIRINQSENRSGWIYLDGRRLFAIASPRTSLHKRLNDIQRNLQQISQDYFYTTNAELTVNLSPEQVTENDKSVQISVNNQPLVILNEEDAKLQRVPLKTAATEIKQTIQHDLKRAKQERDRAYLINQGKIAAIAGLGMIAASGIIYHLQKRFARKYQQAKHFKEKTLQEKIIQEKILPEKHLQEKAKPATPISTATKSITAQLSRQAYLNITEVKKRLLQLAQTAIWGGGILFILNLFPYTRSLQLAIITIAQIPLTIMVFAVGTYVAVRLSYALIDRFTSAFVNSTAILTKEASERLKLRVSTFSGVTKSVATINWLIIGILSGLTALGIDIIPLLAGAGIVGVAISLASQSLIKDAINGFLIILEDQYALGDFISVGAVGGIVEQLNLRMTQIRDAEGRLITIPNSEVKIVANLSSRWSRADLTIPIAYESDVNQALKLIEKIALEMDIDPQWEHQILETPQVLGIDNFTVPDRGLLIRVWIKTKPLKQWAVAREYRRRLKIAFDEAGISIFMS